MDHYLIQKDGEVARWTDKKLRRKLRENDLTGLELARREDDPQWRPLHALTIYREEVPYVGDPRDHARRRMARGFGAHLVIYGLVVGFVLGGPLSTAGIIWGLFLLGHASRALPVVWSLVREGKLLPGGDQAAALPPASIADSPAADSPAAAASALPAASMPADAGTDSTAAPRQGPRGSVQADLEGVRTLIDRQPELDTGLSDELTRMAESISQIDRRIDTLRSLLDQDDDASLAEQHARAQRARDEATLPEDRALRQRQIEVIEQRQAGQQRARGTLERLELRRDLAAQQIRQLHLDLVRAEADQVEPEHLDRRLEQIRLEAEAAAEVENLLTR
ncbi:MAG: hypothetical protein AAGF11_31825 [Myxococcota bacterium]